MVGHLDAGRGGRGCANRSSPPIKIDVALMIDRHRLVRTGNGSGREYRRVVDGCSDDAGTNPPPAQRQSRDGRLTCVYAGPGEEDLIRSRSHCTGDYFPRHVHGLRSQSTGPMESDRIAPSGLLRIKPSLPRIGEHWLARGAIQEDFGDGMRHASKLARICSAGPSDRGWGRPSTSDA